MALALENITQAYQRIVATLETQRASSSVHQAFLDLKNHLVSKGITQLQVLPFAATAIDTGADGAVLLDSAVAKFYAVYAKRVSDVDTTAAFLNVADDATNNATAADVVVVIRTNSANEESYAIIPAGEALSAGIVVSATTAPAGTTESAATESSNGFVVVGAA